MIKKKLLGSSVVGILIVFLLMGCTTPITASASPRTISGTEIVRLFQKTFWLQPGRNLFVTTGEYRVYSLQEIRNILSQIYSEANIPQCRFKAVTVYLGELHQRLDSLIAAGYAMSTKSPPWFLLFLAVDCCGQIQIYGFDPLLNPIDKNAIKLLTRSSQIQLILM